MTARSTAGSTSRLFTAVMPPGEVVEELDEQIEGQPERHRPQVRWNPTHQWHVTLLFTPSVHEDVLDDYRVGLFEAVTSLQPFELGVHGGGAFPELARARHLVALIHDPCDALPELAATHRRVARELGIDFEDRPYRPHLTLGRLQRATDMGRSAGWLDSLRSRPWTVDSTALVHSTPHPRGGAEHRIMARHQLSSRGPTAEN